MRTRLASLLLLVLPAAALAADPLVVDVWPGQPPGDVPGIGEEANQPPRKGEDPPIIRTTNVTKPQMYVYPAPKETRNGAAVLVCPGGGYNILAWNHEGTEVAEWLNSLGVTAVVLKYRVPRRKGLEKHEVPLKDAQRALSYVRSMAKEWHVDTDNIGILGFSAGGHLAATVSTNFDKRSYEAIDAVDEVSCRPDFTVLVYPAYLMNEKNDGLDPLINVTEKTPPVFLVHAYDDRVTPLSSVHYFLAAKQHKVPAELHVFPKGGHGYGMQKRGLPVNDWPSLCETWLRAEKIIPAK